MAYRLVTTRGPLKGRTFVVVKTETRIGRDPTNDLVLPDDYVSRLHATIITRGKQHVLVNASPNGTLVNGKRVEKTVLNPGDEIALGGATVLRYEGDTAAAAAPTKPAPERPAEERKPAAPAAGEAKPVPLWRRKPKLVLSLGVYVAALAALAVFLAMQRKSDAVPEVHYLTASEIEKDLTRPFERPRDPAAAQRALDTAMALHQHPLVNPGNRYAILVAFREAEAYLGSSLSRPEHIQAYNEVLDGLKGDVVALYAQADSLQRVGRYNEARDKYSQIIQYVSNPESAIFKNVTKRLTVLQPFVEKRRWGGGSHP